jgi:hypothetical protein
LLAVLAGLALVVMILRTAGNGDEPAASGFSGRQAPFRGNRLPDDDHGPRVVDAIRLIGKGRHRPRHV